MRPSQITGIAIATFLTVAPAALAQTPPTQQQPPQTSQPQTQPQTTQEKSETAAATQTYAGCVMTEPEYRRAHNLGQGQVGGVGLGDEFVLVDVKVSPANASATTPASDTSASSAAVKAESTTAAKCADTGTAYRLTGSDEEKLKDLVGRQIEIQGRLKKAADATATEAATPAAEKLPAEVEIVSFREAPASTGGQTAPVTTPAPAATTPPATRPQTQPTAPPPPPPTPAATIEPRQDTTPAATARRELPQTAGSAGLYALAGVLALGSGLALMVIRRRLL